MPAADRLGIGERTWAHSGSKRRAQFRAHRHSMCTAISYLGSLKCCALLFLIGGPMQRFFVLSLIGLLATSSSFAQQQTKPGSQRSAAPEKTIAIHATTLIDGTSAQTRHDVLIVVKGNKIVSVSGAATPPAGAEVINL